MTTIQPCIRHRQWSHVRDSPNSNQSLNPCPPSLSAADCTSKTAPETECFFRRLYPLHNKSCCCPASMQDRTPMSGAAVSEHVCTVYGMLTTYTETDVNHPCIGRVISMNSRQYVHRVHPPHSTTGTHRGAASTCTLQAQPNGAVPQCTVNWPAHTTRGQWTVSEPTLAMAYVSHAVLSRGSAVQTMANFRST